MTASESGAGVDWTGLDWASDEAVVRAAKPGCFIGHGTGWIWFDGNINYCLGENWSKARKHPVVQAFERAHNPAFAKPSVDAPAFDWATATPEEKVKRRWPDAWEGITGNVHTNRSAMELHLLTDNHGGWLDASQDSSVIELERQETSPASPVSMPEDELSLALAQTKPKRNRLWPKPAWEAARKELQKVFPEPPVYVIDMLCELNYLRGKTAIEQHAEGIAEGLRMAREAVEDERLIQHRYALECGPTHSVYLHARAISAAETAITKLMESAQKEETDGKQ